MKQYFLLILFLFTLAPVFSQKVERVAKGYVALQNENVGSKDEELIIRRQVNGKWIDIGIVRVILSKQGKTAARIVQEVHPYQIQPGDFAFALKETEELADLHSGIVTDRHWRFAIGPGFGRRIGDLSQNIPPDLDAYHNALKSGFSIKADMVYFHHASTGIGWMVSQWWSDQNAEDKILYDSDARPIDQVDLENHCQIFYTGPAFIVKQPLPGRRFYLYSAMTLGLLQFQDRQTTLFTLDEPIERKVETIQDKTIGIGGEIGLEARINPSLGFYGHLFFLFGTLPRQQSDSNLYQDRISLNRLDFTAGISIYF